MKRCILKYIKLIICLVLIFSCVLPVFAGAVGSDGTAFVTKEEFDVAFADFNKRLTTFEAGLNSKIDAQITSYLDRNGIWNAKEVQFFDGMGYTKNFNYTIGMNTNQLKNAAKASIDVTLSQTRDDWVTVEKDGLLYMIVEQTGSGWAGVRASLYDWHGAWNTFGWFLNFINVEDAMQKGSVSLCNDVGNSDQNGECSIFVGYYPQIWSVLFFVKKGEKLKCIETLSARAYESFTPNDAYGNFNGVNIKMEASIY